MVQGRLRNELRRQQQRFERGQTTIGIKARLRAARRRRRRGGEKVFVNRRRHIGKEDFALSKRDLE